MNKKESLEKELYNIEAELWGHQRKFKIYVRFHWIGGHKYIKYTLSDK